MREISDFLHNVHIIQRWLWTFKLNIKANILSSLSNLLVAQQLLPGPLRNPILPESSKYPGRERVLREVSGGLALAKPVPSATTTLGSAGPGKERRLLEATFETYLATYTWATKN